MVIYSLTSQAGGSQEHLMEVEESAPDFCRDSFAVTTQVSIAAMWEQASPSLYIYSKQSNYFKFNTFILTQPYRCSMQQLQPQNFLWLPKVTKKTLTSFENAWPESLKTLVQCITLNTIQSPSPVLKIVSYRLLRIGVISSYVSSQP